MLHSNYLHIPIEATFTSFSSAVISITGWYLFLIEALTLQDKNLSEFSQFTEHMLFKYLF